MGPLKQSLLERLMGKPLRIRTNKFAPTYQHVVHKTEVQRRERYQGCVSRQTLRAKLREEAIHDIRNQYPTEQHSLVRQMGIAKGNRMYRLKFDLPEPR